MNHLNIFNPYKNKSNYHEDELTRAFLILIKNISHVQNMFFNMVRVDMINNNIDLINYGELKIEEVYTQLSNSNNLFSKDVIEGRNLLSIIISDDRLETETNVQNDDRHAVYDGVMLCEPSWLFIIENKPFRSNIWEGQLNPNIDNDIDITIIDKPCCLSWRVILKSLNDLIQNDYVVNLERTLIEDFIEYVDNEYSWINPYTNFGVCKNDIYLLNKRCISVMDNFLINNERQEVKYHKGWKHFIESGKNTIKLISLDANNEGENWTIDLWLYAGDTMNSARETFEKLDMNILNELQRQEFKISNNFHISYRSSNLLWFKGNLSIEDYLMYWKEEHKSLKQVKRIDFDDLFNNLEKNKMIIPEDRYYIKDKILNKKYDKLNVCPGFLIKYTWDRKTALHLDENNQFEEDFINKVVAAFNVVGGI